MGGPGEYQPVSERIVGLAATAISTAAKRILGIDLHEAQARPLARVTTVREAISLLKDQIAVRRAVTDVVLGVDAQIRIAVREVAAESGRVFDHIYRSGSIREMVLKERDAALTATEIKRQNLRLLELNLENSGYAQRNFVRRVARLHAAQLERLKDALGEEGRFEDARARLDLIYEKYLVQANELS